MDRTTSICAAKAKEAKREQSIAEDNNRSAFQRDRDRIMYSKAFRRLSGKTQVFVAGFDDNIRTRLTHTLEVSQIATTICKAVGLNTELAEAIAYGHDLGHTPFGHVGERFLNHVMNGCLFIRGCEINLNETDKGFKHNLQGERVVTKLEEYPNSNHGLNLTRYTIWGIRNHTSTSYSLESKEKEINRCKVSYCHQTCTISGNYSLGFYKNETKEKNDGDEWTYEAFKGIMTLKMVCMRG